MFFPCIGSDFANMSKQRRTPGTDDFPQIISRQPNTGAFYYIIWWDGCEQISEIWNPEWDFNDTRQWQTFTIPIYVGDVPEGVEEFNFTLSLLPDPSLPPRAVNVTPAVATVRIQDFCKFI